MGLEGKEEQLNNEGALTKEQPKGEAESTSAGAEIEAELQEDINVSEYAKLMLQVYGSDLKDKMTKRLVASARIRCEITKPTSSDYRIIHKIMNYIDFFNNVNEDIDMLWGRSIEQISVINEFVPFLRPLAVRVNIMDRKGKNLIFPARNELGSELHTKYNYEEFEDLQIRFRNILRKESSDNRTSLSAAMKPLNLFDVFDKSCCHSKCANYTDPFIPIILNNSVANGLFEKDRFYHIPVDDVVADYMKDWLK